MTDPAFNCVVSADLVRRAWFCVSTDEARYYLNGVFVGPHPAGGAWVVATNGTVLVAFRDADGIASGPAILTPDKGLRRALSPDYGDAYDRVVMADGASLMVADVQRSEALDLLKAPDSRVIAAQYRDHLIDGKYPDFTRTFVAVDPAGVVPVLQPRFLRRLTRALCVDTHTKALRLLPTGKTEATPIWVLGEMKEAFGILMGMKESPTWPKALPEWVTPATAEAA